MALFDGEYVHVLAPDHAPFVLIVALLNEVFATTHVFQLERLPVSLSDEAGEASLRMDMRMARVASTNADAASEEITRNELYRTLICQRTIKKTTVQFWIGLSFSQWYKNLSLGLYDVGMSGMLELLQNFKKDSPFSTPEIRCIVVEECITEPEPAIYCL